MDKFEQFFRENRLRLDTEDLDSSYSGKIAHMFNMHNRKRVFRQLYAVASIAAIVVLSTLLYLAHNGQHPAEQQPGIFGEIATDLVKEEASYIQSINSSMDAIKKQKIPAEYASMFNDFTQQLQIIDKQYDIYKAQVEQHGYSEEIIQQIIYNYQLKLSVLQMLQSEINKINNLSKHEKHEYKKIQLSI